MCVCLVSCMFACVYVAECVVSDRSICVCVCGVGQVRLCMCVIHGMPSSCRSAGESECVVLGRSACVSVCVWCLWYLAGLSMCVCVVLARSVYVCVRGMPSSCRSAGQSKCVVLGRSVCLCVCVCVCVCVVSCSHCNLCVCVLQVFQLDF